MRVQEQHDVPDRSLITPCLRDFQLALGANAFHLLQGIGRFLDDFEKLFTEPRDQLLGIHRTNAFDHAAAQVLLHALSGIRWHGSQMERFQLPAMVFIDNPIAFRRQPLARRDGRRRADHCDQIAVALRLHLQNTESGLF